MKAALAHAEARLTEDQSPSSRLSHKPSRQRPGVVFVEAEYRSPDHRPLDPAEHLVHAQSFQRIRLQHRKSVPEHLQGV
jgi:hypothetical protein